MEGERIRTVCRGWAKINLTLNITGTKNGLHTLESVLTRVPLYDEVAIEFAEDDQVEYSDGAVYERDNVIRAMEAVRRSLNSERRFRAKVKRNIPSGKGLGASSAAAAAAAVGAAYLLGGEAGEALGASGADSAFQASDCLTALVSGTGDIVEKAELKQKIYVAFCSYPTRSESEKVFAAYDVTGGAGGSTEAFFEDLVPFNALEAAAVSITPEILEGRRALTLAGYDRVVMTGSGAGYIGYTLDPEEHRTNYERLSLIASEKGLEIYDFQTENI